MRRVDEDRVPVIIGVGQLNDRAADLEAALDSLGLMHGALLAAQADCGADVINRLDWLGVVDQISFPNPEIHHDLAAKFGIKPRHVLRTPYPSGEAPIKLISDAATLIANGEISMAAAVGGEAIRTANKRAQQNMNQGEKVDLLTENSAALQSPLARRYGLLTPTDIYPLYENATRAAWRQSFAEAQAEIRGDLGRKFGRSGGQSQRVAAQSGLCRSNPGSHARQSPDQLPLSKAHGGK